MSRTYPLDEIILPMGGTTVKDRDKMDTIWESEEYVAEEKYDGSRYLSVGGKFFSRRISVVDKLPVEKTDNVPHLSSVLSNYPLLILDGEIYIEGGKSNEVVSIMGAKPEKAIARQSERGQVNYVVFDILRDADGNWLTDLPWMDRRGILEEQMEVIFNDHHTAENDISLSDYVLTNKKQFNKEIMERGGEGVMLKNINGKYFPDKKPRWNWIKVKSEITSDVIITGFKAAKRDYEGDELETWQYWENLDKNFEGEFAEFRGNDVKRTISNYEGDELTYTVPATRTYGLDEDGIVRSVRIHGRPPTIEENGIEVLDPAFEPVTKFYFMGWIGAVEFSQYDDKGELKQVGYCSGLTEELRKDITENQSKYIGECMEISAMERTKDGYFRHPQFLRMRPDKNPKDCVLGED